MTFSFNPRSPMSIRRRTSAVSSHVMKTTGNPFNWNFVHWQTDTYKLQWKYNPFTILLRCKKLIKGYLIITKFHLYLLYYKMWKNALMYLICVKMIYSFQINYGYYGIIVKCVFGMEGITFLCIITLNSRKVIVLGKNSRES